MRKWLFANVMLCDVTLQNMAFCEILTCHSTNVALCFESDGPTIWPKSMAVLTFLRCLVEISGGSLFSTGRVEAKSVVRSLL